MAPAFDWNIKQLFVFLVVEYQTTKNVSSHCCSHFTHDS